MPSTVRIADRVVGEGAPCYLIAEAGANHDRDKALALDLIRIAAEAGADAVKFQTYSAETLYSTKTPRPSYLDAITDKSMHDLIRDLELPREWHVELFASARERGLHFLSTPFDLAAVDELDAVGQPAVKIASFEIVDLPLLRRAARTGKPVILSTGMACLSDIEDALNAVYGEGNEQVVLLHCAIGYPPAFEDVHLRAMETLRQAFGVPVGLSDHTMTASTALAAVALGACVIEKHYTTDRTRKGPDHPFALEPDELTALVRGVREVEAALGSPIKRHTAAETELHRLARRSIVAARRIPAGTTITAEMLTVKRPGYGVPPKFLELVVGRIARQDIDADDVVTWDLI